MDNTLKEFEKFVADSAPKVAGFCQNYKKAAWEMLLNGGKRFRPALVFCVVKAYNPLLLQNAFLPALALEALHTYSLIHDDLPCMDNASLRRGKPTLHTKYGEVLALLVGDALNSYAFELLAKSRLPDATKIALVESLAKNAGLNGMVLGQVLDCEFEKTRLPLEKLTEIHINKTAKLIATALFFGAKIVDLDAKKCESLFNFGLNLGLFFQIRDDILDATLDAKTAGKTTQNDANKNSFVNLLGIDGAREAFSVKKAELLDALDGFDSALRENLNSLLLTYFKEI